MKRPGPRRAAENASRRELRKHLQLDFTLLRDADRFLRNLAASLPADPDGSPVAELLSRAADDLRACTLVGEAGFGLQAMTLASCVFESALRAAYIGPSATRAIEWRSASDPDRVQPSVSKCVTYINERLTKGTPTSGGSNKSAYYSVLCCAKHANPILQHRAGVIVTSDDHFLRAHPIITPATMLQFRVAGYIALHAVKISIECLRKDKMVPKEFDAPFLSFLRRYRRLEAVMKKHVG